MTSARGSCAGRCAPTARRCASSPRMPILEVWYAHLDMDDLLPRFRALLDPQAHPGRLARGHEGARPRQHAGVREALPRAGRRAADRPRPAADRADRGPARARRSPTPSRGRSTRSFAPTGARCETDRRHLLDHYRVVHLARKVVGVGSVGTAAWIVLLLDEHDTPLFLQIKEAQTRRCSSSSPRTSEFSHHGAARRRRAAADAGRERHLPRLAALRLGGRASATATSASCATGRARRTSPA